MSERKWKMSRYDTEPTPVEVERETEHFVVIRGRREAKRSGFVSYFDSRHEALEWARDRYLRKLESAGRTVEMLEAKVAAVNEALAARGALDESEGEA